MSGMLVHHLLAERATAQPAAPAYDGLSYRELADWAGQVAHLLHEHGAGEGRAVAVRLNAGAAQGATLLACMLIGSPFVPLDPADPPGRQQEILDALDVAVLVVADNEPPGPPTRGAVLAVPAFQPGGDTLMALPATAPDAPVYIVFTSGSTGAPKGVVQSGRSLAQFVVWMGAEFRMGPGRRVAQWAGPGYDASICELFAVLVSGGTVCPVPENVRLDALRLTDWLSEQRVNLLQTVPSYARELLYALTRRGGPLRDLDHLLLAGEPLPGTLASALTAAVDGLRLVNLYGATETILATWHEVTRQWPDTVPIGRAIPGRQVLVLDAGDRECASGVIGEVVVRSDYLTLGYLDQVRPAFEVAHLPGDAGTDAAVPFYRTGDLAQRRPDGLLEFRGRRDRQVKVRGVRVEPAEIESILCEHPSVLNCAVTVTGDAGEPDRTLIAYVVAADGSGSPRVWRSHLRGRLRDQLMPSSFVPVDELPRNAGGKVHSGQLSAPAGRSLTAFRSWAAGLSGTHDTTLTDTRE